MKNVVLPMLAIALLGAGIGLGFNAIRTKDRISLTRNYFKVAAAAKGASSTTPNDPGDDQAAEASRPDAAKVGSADAADDGESDADGALLHPFKKATLDDVADVVEQNKQYNGEVALVDARKTSLYEEAHIPGAVSLDNYNVDLFWENVRPLLMNADRVIVYCGGGTCADSIFLATELSERGVPFSRIYVFEGGMKEWNEGGFPTESGLDG